MKFKSLFLGMLATAALVSCNNDTIDNPKPVNPDDGNGTAIVPSTGKQTYFSLEMPKSAETYAGEASVTGETYEKEHNKDAAVFVYKWDGVNATPEFYSYIAPGGFQYTTDKVVMKVTDGTKKLYVALNIGPNATAGDVNFFGTALPVGATTTDEGASYSTMYSSLNKTLWAATFNTWSFNAPASGSEEGTANGLIRSLAGGAFVHTNGILRTPTTAPPANTIFFLMSNWDNNVPDTTSSHGASDYVSTCLFTFDPDVPKTDASGGIKNQAVISVQRAVAKVSLNFTAPAAPAAFPNSYVSDGQDSVGSKGIFTPWEANVAATPKGIWAVGNINKETTVFQRFTGGAVSDGNYAQVASYPAGSNNDWYKNFDNTRVFGTGKLYYTAGNTVTNVKNTMKNNPNSIPNSNQLGAGFYEYVTENAQSYASGYQENSTFALVGGQYIPQFWISNIVQAKVVTNEPIISYNQAPIPVDSVAGSIHWGPEYTAVPYPNPVAGDARDSLYYHTAYQVFIYGRDNLAKYYAWVQKKDPTTTTPTTSTAVITAINADLLSNALVTYFQGNCFYRVFVRDNKALLATERVLVRRNHIYDISISKILGPGIADPNKIINPDTPVNPTETYIAITITIQDWHKITQDEVVEGK